MYRCVDTLVLRYLVASRDAISFSVLLVLTVLSSNALSPSSDEFSSRRWRISPVLVSKAPRMLVNQEPRIGFTVSSGQVSIGPTVSVGSGLCWSYGLRWIRSLSVLRSVFRWQSSTLTVSPLLTLPVVGLSVGCLSSVAGLSSFSSRLRWRYLRCRISPSSISSDPSEVSSAMSAVG